MAALQPKPKSAGASQGSASAALARVLQPQPTPFNGHAGHNPGLRIYRENQPVYTRSHKSPFDKTMLRNATASGTYDGAELRAPLRAGAADHENHPSRAGNLRSWRDGRTKKT